MQSDNTIVILEREPLNGLNKQEFQEKLVSNLKGRVKECWIFGSFHTDLFHKDSDVDLILIKDTETPFTQRASEFMDIRDLAASVDILVYTPAEFRELLKEETGFWKSVKETMQRIL